MISNDSFGHLKITFASMVYSVMSYYAHIIMRLNVKIPS